MSCNSCAKPYNLFRKEKGCPSCGFSYCSKCLDNKMYVEKLKAEAKVCKKCANNKTELKAVEPPAAYYKRVGQNTQGDNETACSQDQEIHARLQRLKQDAVPQQTSEEEIAARLKNIKGEVPSTSDAELQLRLANLRGVPVSTLQSMPILPIVSDTRSEQEQADDLLKQYMEQTQIDGQYKDEFDALVNDMETRMNKLKDGSTAARGDNKEPAKEAPDSEDEEELVKKIVEKIKVESSLEDDEISTKQNDELPFCEICNEDATMRCLGCRYLFCKRCFLDHKDDDDGCDRYEPYKPPRNS